MYGHVSAPTRVYRYGARTPHEGLDALRSQEREAHRLRNALIEIERDRRAAAEAAILAHAPDVAAALARVAEIDAAIEIERVKGDWPTNSRPSARTGRSRQVRPTR